MSFNISPQAGPQEMFLASTADVAIYGGAAGGGKSYALLLEPLRHYHNPKFSAVIFRRNSTQVRNTGGLWHESMAMYHQLNGHPREAFLEWIFPSGAKVKFAHLELERTIYDWQGSQIALLCFDELTHFSETQFCYMLSRNRSVSGVPGYVRATCNPDASSWVRTWIDWYIDDKGYAIPERSGVLRWFIRKDDQIIWGDSRQELLDIYGATELPKSFTFIPSRLADNKILMEKDPSYLSNLQALSKVDRERLLYGNWNIKPSAGNFFNRAWFEFWDEVPHGYNKAVRYWDRAATKPSEKNRDPDWTRGLKLLRYPNGTWLIADLASIRDTPLAVETLIRNTASQDGSKVIVVGEQDPGSAGVADANAFTRLLNGYIVKIRKPTTDKQTRAKPVAAQCEANNIKILRAQWNEELLRELENFPDESYHDDIVDTLSGAYNELVTSYSMFDTL